MAQTPQAKARTRNLAAARRSLDLIAEAVARHQAALKDTQVPEDDFTASVLKYRDTLTSLRLLGSLSDGPAPDGSEPATAEVRLDDLGALVLFAHGFLTEAAWVGSDSPVTRLTQAAFPDGVPQPATAANGSTG